VIVRFPSATLLVVASIVTCGLLGPHDADRTQPLSSCVLADSTRSTSLHPASTLDDDVPGDDDLNPEGRPAACECRVPLPPAPASTGRLSPPAEPPISGPLAARSLASRAPPVAREASA